MRPAPTAVTVSSSANVVSCSVHTATLNAWPRTGRGAREKRDPFPGPGPGRSPARGDTVVFTKRAADIRAQKRNLYGRVHECQTPKKRPWSSSVRQEENSTRYDMD